VVSRLKRKSAPTRANRAERLWQTSPTAVDGGEDGARGWDYSFKKGPADAGRTFVAAIAGTGYREVRTAAQSPMSAGIAVQLGAHPSGIYGMVQRNVSEKRNVG